MQYYQVGFHVPGTLGANVTIKWTAPFDCQLVHVSSTGSNTNNGILNVGSSATAGLYVLNQNIGDGGVPAEAVLATFVGTQFPHIVDGTIIAIALDYDGAGGTATADFTIVLTFTKG